MQASSGYIDEARVFKDLANSTAQGRHFPWASAPQLPLEHPILWFHRAAKVRLDRMTVALEGLD